MLQPIRFEQKMMIRYTLFYSYILVAFAVEHPEGAREKSPSFELRPRLELKA